MTAEQQHGKSFEALVKQSSGLFPKAANLKIKHTAIFDIPGEFTEDSIPASIKLAKCDLATGTQPTLGLSDARRFYQCTTSGTMRLIAGIYAPASSLINVYTIHDMIITPEMKTILWGDLEAEDIHEFSDRIAEWSKKDSDSGIRKRTNAQRLAKRYKGILMQRGGIVSLNQKINSTNHRLQCSVNLTHLRAACRDKGNSFSTFSGFSGDKRSYGLLSLPLAMSAGRRGAGTRALA